MRNRIIKNITIYQAKNGSIEFRGDFERETIWGNLNQIANLFGRDKSVISRHINKIYKAGELEEMATVAKIATVQKEGEREVEREIEYYNLDMILSVGYRVDSKQATQFRIWATKTLKQHLIQGYTVNKQLIGKNYEKFMRAVSDVKALLPAGNKVKTEEILELIRAFAGTWFSLDAYDKDRLPRKGVSKKQVAFTAEELINTLEELKKDLIKKKEATEIFGQERSKGNVLGIVGNVFQSIFGKDAYPSVEEKAAHILYFMVKNHPFIDGNKRSGAFAFVWFLRQAGILRASLTPEALTAITLLVAESHPKDKDKMIGVVLLLLNGNY
ncbi:virulence protein RhuM/Fic/DOC family protein [Candidatus Falkowbacteria bacterium]|jgi:prophage maintenance system killer protein|nr:virulence protein RhuM/Fic/DOC family protein [Candidatus Falkowbacteria bacterium]MBT7006913.1 virulence protein RhuM/Fic/DOC family protein [Candidatus Falkowbacteria bacterium]